MLVVLGDVELYAEIESLFLSIARKRAFLLKGKQQFNLLRIGKMVHAMNFYGLKDYEGNDLKNETEL